MHHMNAIDIDGLPGDIRGAGRGQKDRHRGDVFGGLPASQRYHRADLFVRPSLIRKRP